MRNFDFWNNNIKRINSHVQENKTTMFQCSAFVPFRVYSFIACDQSTVSRCGTFIAKTTRCQWYALYDTPVM